MSVEFTNPGTAQNINFGLLPSVIGLTSKSVSFWIRSDDVSSDTTQSAFLISDGTGTDSDEYFDFYPAGAKFGLIAHFSTTNGLWITTNNVIAASSWYHVVITYNATSTSNNPLMYINGESKAVTRTTAPVGSYRTGAGNNSVYVGHTESTLAPDARLADVRVYNTILTAGQVLALYNDGPFSPNYDTNLVFHALLSDCSAKSGAAFDGLTLTSSQKFYDRIGCAEGTPSGSPVGSDTNPT